MDHLDWQWACVKNGRPTLSRSAGLLDIFAGLFDISVEGPHTYLNKLSFVSNLPLFETMISCNISSSV